MLRLKLPTGEPINVTSVGVKASIKRKESKEYFDNYPYKDADNINENFSEGFFRLSSRCEDNIELINAIDWMVNNSPVSIKNGKLLIGDFKGNTIYFYKDKEVSTVWVKAFSTLQMLHKWSEGFYMNVPLYKSVTEINK